MQILLKHYNPGLLFVLFGYTSLSHNFYRYSFCDGITNPGCQRIFMHHFWLGSSLYSDLRKKWKDFLQLCHLWLWPSTKDLSAFDWHQTIQLHIRKKTPQVPRVGITSLLYSYYFMFFAGLFERNRCPRGKNCNFLHVYHNPSNEFNHRDELSPGRTPRNGWGSERSERDWRRDPRSRHRDMSRDRSRERDWDQDRHRRNRKRDRSRERDDGRGQHHRHSKERERSRTSERHEKRSRVKYSGDESDPDDRQISDR